MAYCKSVWEKYYWNSGNKETLDLVIPKWPLEIGVFFYVNNCKIYLFTLIKSKKHIDSWSKLKERYTPLFLLAKLNFFETLSKPALKGLTIAASTVAVVELLKQDYSVGVSAAISWLLLVIASKRILKWFAYYSHY